MLRQFATAVAVSLCLLPPLCGSLPMCTDGQSPLMEANDAFPCSRGCPRGFYCEFQDSLENPLLGICCANRTELQVLYGSNDKQVDPIWKDEDFAEHKSSALAVEAYSFTQAPGSLFIHTRTIDDNDSNEALARNEHKVEKTGNDSIHITVTDNLPAVDDPLAAEVVVDSDKSLGPSLESRFIEEFFPSDDDGLYAEVSAFNATEILNSDDYIDANSTSLQYPATNSTLVTIKALSAGRKHHAKKSSIKNSEEEVVLFSSEAKDSKEAHRNWEKDDSAEKLTAPKGVFQVLSKKDDLSTDVSSSELSNSADKTSAQGNLNVNIKNANGKQSARGVSRSKNDQESEEREEKHQYSCQRQNYELTCNSGTIKTQPKIRWFLNDNGECEHYPWGYCPGDRVADSTTIRTKEDCLRVCLGYTAEELENAKDAKLKDESLSNPTEIQFQEEPLEQLHDRGDKVVSEKSPVTQPPVTAETQTCETSTVKQGDEERDGVDGKEKYGHIDEKNSKGGADGEEKDGHIDEKNSKGGADGKEKDGHIDEKNSEGGADGKEKNGHIDEKNSKVGKSLDSAPLKHDEKTRENQPDVLDEENNEEILTENSSVSNDQILCTATSYRLVCKSGLRSQFVYRWNKVDGKCLSFPYGYCVYEYNHPHPRTLQECEKYC